MSSLREQKAGMGTSSGKNFFFRRRNRRKEINKLYLMYMVSVYWFYLLYFMEWPKFTGASPGKTVIFRSKKSQCPPPPGCPGDLSVNFGHSPSDNYRIFLCFCVHDSNPHFSPVLRQRLVK